MAKDNGLWTRDKRIRDGNITSSIRFRIKGMAGCVGNVAEYWQSHGNAKMTNANIPTARLDAEIPDYTRFDGLRSPL